MDQLVVTRQPGTCCIHAGPSADGVVTFLFFALFERFCGSLAWELESAIVGLWMLRRVDNVLGCLYDCMM